MMVGERDIRTATDAVFASTAKVVEETRPKVPFPKDALHFTDPVGKQGILGYPAHNQHLFVAWARDLASGEFRQVALQGSDFAKESQGMK